MKHLKLAALLLCASAALFAAGCKSASCCADGAKEQASCGMACCADGKTTCASCPTCSAKK